MKKKKIFLFMILAMIFMLIAGTSMTYAKTEYVVGLKAVRNYPGHENSGTTTLQGDKTAYAYAINSKIIWKLLEYEDATVNEDYTVESDTGTANWNNTTYCLKAGLGFTNVDSEGGLTAIEEEKIRVLYRFSELMTAQEAMEMMESKLKESRAVPYQSLLKTALTTERNNAVLWILDNSYMRNFAYEDTKIEMKKYLFSNMLAYINNPNNTVADGLMDMLIATDSLELENIVLTDNDIDVIQQAAIWYHTNYDDAAYNYELPAIKLSEEALPDTNSYVNIENMIGAETDPMSEGNKRLVQAQALFYYLTRASEKAAGNYSNVRNLKPTLQFENKQASMEVQENKTIVGPFTYNVNTNGKNVYRFIPNVQIQKLGETEYSTLEEAEFSIVRSDKETEATIEELKGEEFYVVIPQSQITKVKVKVNATYLETQATIWMAEDPTITQEQTEQPIVIVEKAEPEISDEKEVTADLEFDLALRKYITAINGEKLPTDETRVPNINTSVLEEETTAEYKHKKDPVEVKTGDKVTYTITIYNEGDIPGRATEIIDQLPDGLEFIRIISGNYTAEEMENNQIRFTAEEPREDSRATPLQHMLQPYTGGTLDSESIVIECEVTEKQSKDSKILTNVAWISADTNTENVTDRDSQPENSPANKNVPDYKGNENNKPQLDDKNYHYEGEQDDDDFEKLILPEIYFDLALRKYITAINGEKLPTDETRVPKINTDVLENETTAEYKHKKDPVEVKTGDKVTYTITIYNEGDIAGRATEVIDQLPDGLEFIRIISGNYTAEEMENNQIRFTAKEPEIDPQSTDGEYMLQPYTGGTLDSESIVIECEVTEKQSKDSKILTNVAWISADTNTENATDRDSQPENSPVNKNVPDYKGNENNKPQLDDKNYHYEGEQDDDDFEKLILPESQFDLSLRKFIVSVNGVELNGANSRVPVVDTTPLKNNTGTTAIYTHSKTPVAVKKGDVVIYTIRVYNEGDTDGYVEELTDYLPEGLGYLVSHKLNTENRWLIADTAKAIKLKDIPEATNNLDLQDFEEEFVTSLGEVDVVVGKTELKTSKLAYRELESDNLITAYNGGDTLAYKDVQIACVVISDSLESKALKNIAEITKAKDKWGNDMNEDGDDRDSTPNTVNPNEYPEDKNMQDDDDYENLVLTHFDLALRKFISKVNGIEEEVSRAPIARPDDEKKIRYEHPKDPVKVRHNDLVTYTLRIFNEGSIAGYAEEIKDLIPDGLQFVADNETNKAYGWKMYKVVDGKEVETEDETEATIIRTDYLSKAKNEKNLIEAFDGIEHISQNGNYYVPDYKDVEVVLKVIEPSSSERVLRNIAEISKDADEKGNEINDVDSTPDNYPDEDKNRNEDDVDYDDVVLTYFDLALRKFITEIKTGEVIEKVEDRIPQVSYENEEIHYTHPKDPILVANGSNITYTIRIYNEGKMAGYATEITDNIPDGLTFLPEDNTNKEYRWIMIDAEGNETDNIEEAVKITTDYLSKEQEKTEGENLIKPFDKTADISETNPDYRDVKVVFKVTEEKLPEDRIIINTAEISDDSDEKGREVEDEDSTPGNNKEDEDDIDTEAVKVKYFDLSLLKYVSKIIVTEDGETKVTETGYNGLENPEPIPKVEIKHNKLNSTTVKFAYTIKITNEGEIEGYATEITDDIPSGLQFIADDNPQWTEKDGKIVTRALENTLLQPGESATVEVIFTWINDKNNMGEKINTAEISEDYNEYGSPDIDSTPGNEKEGEDDIDIAKVILSIKTGKENILPILTGTIIIFTILGGGVFLIKKYVI